MKHKHLFIFSIIIILLFVSQETLAAETGVLDSVLSDFKTISAKWATGIINAGKFLFFALGTISLTWTLGLLLMRRAEIGEVFSELIKFTVFFGFMYFIFINAPEIGKDIISSFLKLASSAGGKSEAVTASGIVDIGYNILVKTGKTTSAWNIGQSILLVLSAIIICIALCYVAVNFIATQISAYILLNSGVFVLGFGGSRWTSDIALNYYKTLIGMGLQLLTMILLVTLGNDIINKYNSLMAEQITLENLAIMLLVSMFLVISVGKIPPMVGGLINGPTGGTSFAGSGMALAGVAAAMATAATAMTSAAGAIAKSLAGNAVGASQLMDALKSPGSDNHDTTPDIPDVGTSSNMDSQTQGTPGENGTSGDNGNQGEPGENASKNEENVSSAEKSDSQTSQNNDPIVEKPRSMGERLKQATSTVGNQVISDVKSSFKESVHNLGANSTLGKLGQRISENSPKPTGTGSISGVSSSSSKTKKVIDQMNKSQEW